MASWGLAAVRGHGLWEDARRKEEENERYLAGRDLFMLGLSEASKDAEVQAEAKSEARRIDKSLNKYKTKINKGDRDAFATFLSDAFGTTWANAGGVIFEVGQDGVPTGRTMETSDMSGAELVAEAKKLATTSSEVSGAVGAANAQNLATQLDLTKAQMDANARIQSADISGRYSLAGAQAGANADMQKIQMQYMQNLQNMAMGQAASQIVPGGIYRYNPADGSSAIFTADGNPVTLSPEQSTQFSNLSRQFISEGFNMYAQQGMPMPFGVVQSSNDYARNDNLNRMINSVTSAGLGAFAPNVQPSPTVFGLNVGLPRSPDFNPNTYWQSRAAGGGAGGIPAINTGI